MIDREELEDRARLLLTRRRFLFLGAAAAGAAILKPPPLWTPPRSEWIAGPISWADWPPLPVIPEEAFEYLRRNNELTAKLTGYYDLKAIDAIKKRCGTTVFL